MEENDRDNIKVSVRIRPISEREFQDSGSERCVSMPERNSICLQSYPSNKYFAYDLVCDEDTTQESMFDLIARRIAKSCLEGYNGTIFAYGQTGAGKTYTILGPLEQQLSDHPKRGLLPRAIEYIFAQVHSQPKQDFLIRASFLEIYNENINDLLNPELKHLQLREDMKSGAYVESLTENTVFSIEDVYELLTVGMKNRHIGETFMNKESSRAHSVFTLQIEIKERKNDIVRFRSSRFHLIDLAGSERQKLTAAGGDRLREAGMINKSLSILGNVINSLVEIGEGRCRHVHYRDSKLTFLLKDSLGGNSKTCIIANVSPSPSCFGETLSTLRFAERAKLVRNRAIINEDTVGTLNELKEEIRRLKEQLAQKGECNHKDMDIIKMNERVLEVETLLEESIKAKESLEQTLESTTAENKAQVEGLSEAIKKFEGKIASDSMLIKFRDETIRKIQGNRPASESGTIKELRGEIAFLRKELSSNPAAYKLQIENDALRSHLKSLEREIKETPNSLAGRIRENQEFSRKLSASLKKSISERRQLLTIISEYSKYTKDPQEDLHLQIGYLQKQVEDLQQKLKAAQNVELEFEREDLSRFSDVSSITINELVNPQSPAKSDMLKQLTQELEGSAQQLEMKDKEIGRLKERNRKGLRDKKGADLKIVKLEEEVVRLKDTIERAEESISSLKTQIEDVTTENQFLVTNIEKMKEEIAEKNQVIEDLSQESFKPNVEEYAHLQLQIEHLEKASSRDAEQITELSKNLQLSIDSREEILAELKKAQVSEESLRAEIEELKKIVSDMSKENEKIHSFETEKLQINMNQKIKLFTRMKEENNKLKYQNHKIREEARRNQERLEDMQRKYEILSKTRGKKELDDIEESLYKKKIASLEDRLDKYQRNDEVIFEILTRRNVNVYSSDLAENAERLCADLEGRDKQIMELETEIDKKNSKIQLLENEFLLFKQKIELQSKNLRK